MSLSIAQKKHRIKERKTNIQHNRNKNGAPCPKMPNGKWDFLT